MMNYSAVERMALVLDYLDRLYEKSATNVCHVDFLVDDIYDLGEALGFTDDAVYHRQPMFSADGFWQPALRLRYGTDDRDEDYLRCTNRENYFEPGWKKQIIDNFVFRKKLSLFADVIITP